MKDIKSNESIAKLGLFLQELTKLSDEYNMVIKGCGCCGSPWIEDLEYGETYNDLSIDVNGKYVIEG